MTFAAFLLIIFSAVLHAGWNLLAKKSTVTLTFYTLICSVCALFWIHIQFWTPLPVWTGMPGEFWLYIILTLSSDMIYCSGLVRAYRMEMSTVYPMMRSLPLLMTALLTSLMGWGQPLTGVSICGMIVVFCGCMLMPQKDFRSFNLKQYLNRNLLFILVVACGTTGYTVFDSQAMKVIRSASPDVSSTIVSLTYYSTRGFLLCCILWPVILSIPGERACLFEYWRSRSKSPLFAGLFATLSYPSVLLAMNYVTNVSFVQAFRQLGLVIGLAAGILILKEKCTATKITGVILIVLGLALSVLRF